MNGTTSTNGNDDDYNQFQQQQNRHTNNNYDGEYSSVGSSTQMHLAPLLNDNVRK